MKEEHEIDLKKRLNEKERMKVIARRRDMQNRIQRLE